MDSSGRVSGSRIAPERARPWSTSSGSAIAASRSSPRDGYVGPLGAARRALGRAPTLRLRDLPAGGTGRPSVLQQHLTWAAPADNIARGLRPEVGEVHPTATPDIEGGR
jgi:hypothetical protein